MLSLLWMCLIGGVLYGSLVEALPSGIKEKFRVTGTGTVEGDTTLLELHLEKDHSDMKTVPQVPATLPGINIRLSDNKAVQLHTPAQRPPVKNPVQMVPQPKLPDNKAVLFHSPAQKPPVKNPAHLISQQKLPVPLAAFEDEMVKRHNHYRQIHLSPPLRFDKQLAAYAKIHANRLATMGSLVHENQTILKARNQGENLGSRCSYLPLNNEIEKRKSIRKIVKKWYNEVCQYNFETPSFQRNIGHFSQVDWSGSRDIGVGIAFSKNKKGMNCMYVVGRYRPAGNVDTSKAFQQNVHQGMFHRMSYCRPQVLADENV